ncbi:MAG: hypothetical protein JNM58_12690 [Xanthomonadaceae bacterium]|nr:hypothetical protein [Xanthomonadaceae bacterium]
MSKARKHWKKLFVAMAGMAVVGAAVAAIPAPGTYWQERTFYNSSGTAIGGVYYECSGHVSRWGNTSGSGYMKVQQGPCSDD